MSTNFLISSRIVSCCRVWRVLKWVNVHTFTGFCFSKGLERSQFVLLHCLLPWFQLSYPFCTVMYCCTCGFSASALAAQGMLSWAPWWTLFCWAPWGSLLCPWGSPWAAWFSWAPWWTLLFCTPWGSLLCPWGLPGLLGVSWAVCPPAAWLCIAGVGSLLSCTCLACCESFSPSTADFLSEMKLKLSFSAMSQCAVLALTQSSKVLKEIDSLCVSLTGVLKEFALLTLCSLSWNENLVPVQTYPGSWKKSFLPLLLTVSLTLLASSFPLVTHMPFITGVLKWVNCVSVLLVSFLYVGWGLERSFCACFPDDSYAIYTKGLEMSQLMSVVLISTSGVSWGLERSLSVRFSSDSYAIYIKGLERESTSIAFSCPVCWLGSWKECHCMCT